MPRVQGAAFGVVLLALALLVLSAVVESDRLGVSGKVAGALVVSILVHAAAGLILGVWP